MTLKVGDLAPDFMVPATFNRFVNLKEFRGKNVVLVFFPLAWTPIWTSQIPSYEAQLAKFEGFNTQVLGISVDHLPCLHAWQESIGGISYPLCSDFWPHGSVAEKYGVMREDGSSERAIFIVDAEGIIQYIDIHDIDNQPDNEEIFKILRALNPDLEEASTEEKLALPTGDIIMYCTSWCPDCKKARKWLADHKIDYVEIDIDKYPEASKNLRKITGGDLITPTFAIKEKYLIDFDEEKMEKMFL